MKSLFFSVSLFMFSIASVSACQVSEAQIIGTVTEAKALEGGCLVQLQLSHANRHVFCPLNVGVGHVIELKVESEGSACSNLVGTEISGILQNAGGGFRLDR